MCQSMEYLLEKMNSKQFCNNDNNNAVSRNKRMQIPYQMV